MPRIKVDTGRVLTAASKIKNLNGQMKTGFENVSKAMRTLDNAWDSPVASRAMSKLNDIKNTYCNARYDVMDDYVAFLNQRVGEGYTKTETANRSLASRFK